MLQLWGHMNPAVAQPLSAIDIETIVLGAMAVLFAAVWVRDRERGMSWIATAMALAALWYFNSERVQFEGPNMDTPAVRRWGLVIGSAILLINVGNAAKFSREAAEPRIQVDASFSGEALVLCVNDNGIGFDPAVAAQMFTPFHRFHGSRFEGHGLGLSLVRRAVERHGGRVRATSSPGHGASFCFEIPAASLSSRSEAAVEPSG